MYICICMYTFIYTVFYLSDSTIFPAPIYIRPWSVFYFYYCATNYLDSHPGRLSMKSSTSKETRSRI